jgi:hypothetical protein
VIWWQRAGFGQWARPRWRDSLTDSQPGRVRVTPGAVYGEATRPAKQTSQAERFEGLPPLNLHVAGIDVGSAEHHVAVPTGRDVEPVQKFGSFTADLHRMAQWLRACRIEAMIMQATGVYWTALYDVLERYELQVNVVNARHTKMLPGRKTDMQEC